MNRFLTDNKSIGIFRTFLIPAFKKYSKKGKDETKITWDCVKKTTPSCSEDTIKNVFLLTKTMSADKFLVFKQQAVPSFKINPENLPLTNFTATKNS